MNPDVVWRYLRARLPLPSQACCGLVDGVCNPRDLLAVLDPRRDRVVLVSGEAKTPFERDGLAAIEAVVTFLCAHMGLSEPLRVTPREVTAALRNLVAEIERGAGDAKT